jgi:AraC-like DNA-binding protein
MTYDLSTLYRWLASELGKSPRTSLGALARRCAVSRYTLMNAIKCSGKTSFRQLQADVIEAKIAQLMSSGSNLSIKEMAYMLGYGSSRAFGRFIRQRFDLTPSQLRSVMTTAKSARSASDPLVGGNQHDTVDYRTDAAHNLGRPS